MRKIFWHYCRGYTILLLRQSLLIPVLHNYLLLYLLWYYSYLFLLFFICWYIDRLFFKFDCWLLDAIRKLWLCISKRLLILLWRRLLLLLLLEQLCENLMFASQDISGSFGKGQWLYHFGVIVLPTTISLTLNYISVVKKRQLFSMVITIQRRELLCVFLANQLSRPFAFNSGSATHWFFHCQVFWEAMNLHFEYFFGRTFRW